MSARNADMGGVYAHALAGAAEAKGLLAEAGDQLAAFDALWRRDAQVRAFFLSGAVARAAKERAVESAFRGRASDVFADFLRVLLARNRLWLLPDVAVGYAALLDKRLGRVRVTITTAAPASAAEVAAWRDRLAAATGKQPIVEHLVRPALVGGAVIRVGDVVADGSVRRRLVEIEAGLRRAGRLSHVTPESSPAAP
jgi:F-type H+-transporting ATPase subunit delta